MAEATYPRQQALQSPETSATVLHAILREKYGEEFYEWDPTTVYLETRADWNADMCPEAVDRMSAIQVVMTSNAFFQRLDCFLPVANSLNDGSPFFESFSPVSVEECAWAIAEVALNREMLPFAYPIRQYIKTILRQNGYEDGHFPAIFNEVLGRKVSSAEVRAALGANHNVNGVDSYIREQLTDLAFQFSKIPDLRGLDELILQRGLEEAVQESVGE